MIRFEGHSIRSDASNLRPIEYFVFDEQNLLEEQNDIKDKNTRESMWQHDSRFYITTAHKIKQI